MTEYTHDQVQRELERWTQTLITAKATGDLIGIAGSRAFLDTWLDRMNALNARVPA